ncbi:MAG TPA: hypothetical protein VJZ26_09235, partial [Blastocatellia bacterium]|nr:hypothetical protein [Blastocatellia bacterium]
NIYLNNFWMFHTDDRGVYRIYGLPPGRYLVSAGVDKSRGMMQGNGNSYYERTFHPGVTDESKATPVELAEGAEATGVDIVMGRAEKAYAANGRIVDAETGKPLANLMYGYGEISPDGQYIASVMISGSRSNAKGEFRIEGVVPGRYAVFIYSREDSDLYSDPASFEITDADVSGIELKVGHGSSITGVVVIEEATEQDIAGKFSDTTIACSVSSPPKQLSAPRYNRLKINPDGSFRISGLNPGKARFHIADYPARGFHLIRVERDGVDQREGIEIAAGERVSGVKVVIGHGTGVIRGLLKIEEGAFPEGTRFVITGRRVGDTSPFVHIQAESDTRGRFLITGLLSGEYEIFIANRVTSNEDDQPLGFQPATQKVTVTSGAEVQVVLALKPLAKNN